MESLRLILYASYVRRVLFFLVQMALLYLEWTYSHCITNCLLNLSQSTLFHIKTIIGDWHTCLAQHTCLCLYLVKQFTVSCCDTIQAVQLSKGNQRQNVAGKEDYWSQTDLFCVAKIHKMHFYLHFINKMNKVTTQNSFVIINIQR